MTLAETVRRDGYVVVRNLLSAAEVADLRLALTEHFACTWRWEGLGKHQPNAAFTIEGIEWLFAHPGILRVFRQICGEQAVFTTNCDAHMNMLSWWHKDLGDTALPSLLADGFGRASCGLYRAGVYLQDHSQHGLTVRVGSHRERRLDVGVPKHLDTRVGDIVFFDMRLTHAGQFADPIEAALLRAGRKLQREATFSALKERYSRLRQKSAKLSIFFTFGDGGRETEEFCQLEWEAKRRLGYDESGPKRTPS